MELKAFDRNSAEAGLIPVIAYNKDKNLPLAVDAKAFDRAFRKVGAKGSLVLQLENGENLNVRIQAVQFNKLLRTPEHIDFYIA